MSDQAPPPPPGSGDDGFSTPPPPPPPPSSGAGGFSAPPPPPPPGSGGGGYGPPPPVPMGGGAVDHPKAVTILVLGILSLVCCSPLGIVALIMGNNALKEIDAQPGRYSNRQMVQIGRILGIIGIVFLAITIVWFLFLGGLTAISGSSN